MSNFVFVAVVIAYEMIAFLAARMMFPHMDPDLNSSMDRFMTALMALLGGHFWPLAAPIALILWKPRKTPKQVAAENERMKQRIAQLEHELGIGGRT